MGPEREPVDDRRGEPRVGERLAPLGERRVAGDRDAGPLVALGEDLEQQLRTAPVEVEIAELVQTEKVEPPVLADDPAEVALVLGLDELVDQGGRGHVADPEPALAGGDPQADQEMRLAGPAVAQEDDGLARADPGALVAIEACALNRLDLWVRGGLPNLRLTYPHVLGSDIAGRVLETFGRAPLAFYIAHLWLFALIGVGLTAITGNGLFDGIGTLAIGVLLVAVAIVLGMEMKSLLVGEGANPEDEATIRAAIEAHPRIVRLIHAKTLYLGPEELLVAAKVGFDADLPLSEVATAIDEIEADVRGRVPIARVIYLEADVYRPEKANPPTDAIVIKSAD